MLTANWGERVIGYLLFVIGRKRLPTEYSEGAEGGGGRGKKSAHESARMNTNGTGDGGSGVKVGK